MLMKCFQSKSYKPPEAWLHEVLIRSLTQPHE